MGLFTSRLPQEAIYSRHTAKDHLEGLLEGKENFVFGLDKRDSFFIRRRTYWFITETKLVFIESAGIFGRKRDIYYLDNIVDMRLFEDEEVLVIQLPNETNKFELETELEYSFASQAIEQYERFQEMIESVDFEEVYEEIKRNREESSNQDENKESEPESEEGASELESGEGSE